eukprot:TRINITY_DN12226_c0_g1_i5.p1 TRINITY_DN12226_c0_g1~~TRINITY_DN12226_c0_g1_i5.p1  ORF type:complete len:742 (-),score=173.30 TRINITY_DN12226_c0_g1_i5:293-2518(-)
MQIFEVARTNVAIHQATLNKDTDTAKVLTEDLNDREEALRKLLQEREELGWKASGAARQELSLDDQKNVLVSGVFPRVDHIQALLDRAEAVGLDAQSVSLGDMSGLIRFRRVGGPDGQDPSPSQDVVVVLRPGQYVKVYLAPYLRASLKSGEFHGVKDNSPESKALRGRKHKLTDINGIWSLRFSSLFDQIQQFEDVTGSPAENEEVVQLDTDSRTITISRNRDETIELACNNSNQANIWYQALRLAARFEIRVGPNGRDFSSISEAIRAAPTDRPSTILIDPGLYPENLVIDRAVTLRPVVKVPGGMAALPGEGAKKLSKQLVVIQPERGSAVKIKYSPLPGSAERGGTSFDQVVIEDLVLRSSFEEVTQPGSNQEGTLSETSNSVVDYGYVDSSEVARPFGKVTLKRCDIGNGPVGVLCSGHGAQKLTLLGCVVHSTQYAAVLVQHGASIDIQGSAVKNNFAFGVLGTGAKSVVRMQSIQDYPNDPREAVFFDDLHTLDSVDDNPDACLVHHGKKNRSCHVCCKHDYPDLARASVIMNNAAFGILVDNSARLELTDSWIHGNNTSITGNGSSAKIVNSFFWMTTHAVAMVLGMGSSVQIQQNVCNHQLVSVDGQCHINKKLSTAVQDYTITLGSANNKQPGIRQLEPELERKVYGLLNLAAGTGPGGSGGRSGLTRGVFLDTSRISPSSPPPFETELNEPARRLPGIKHELQEQQSQRGCCSTAVPPNESQEDSLCVIA